MKDDDIYQEVDVRDFALVSTPLLNKGMSFTDPERDEFNLFGLLPPHVSTLSDQVKRSYKAFKNKTSDLEKYIYLRELQDSNETLFYKVLTENISEMMPIIYTPTVGLGCEQFSHVYRRQRGVFIAYPYKDRIARILANPRFDKVEVIVVSDGERILGLGDLGAGGMGIPIGKLSLYSACAGIHPASTLPILLDTGTNNNSLLNDPLYIGWRHERLRGTEYDDFIDVFVQAVKKRFPSVLLQWEDFAKQNANTLLTRYRDELLTFNDDIQGTAAVALGTLISAVKRSGQSFKCQKIVVAGAGSAGCGLANLMLQAMIDDGLSEKEALSQIYLVDQDGLLIDGMVNLLPFQKKFAHPSSILATFNCKNKANISLKDVISQITATVLIGVSGQAGLFNEEIVKIMSAKVARPIILPLSNPTACSEATPASLMLWTGGRVLMGTGSPYADIEKDGCMVHVDQTNNAYIFPGLGLGLIAVKAKRVTDKMFMLAAKALADFSLLKNVENENLLPKLSDIREVSFNVAVVVAKEAIDSNLASSEFAKFTYMDLEHLIRKKMWEPQYLPYKYVPKVYTFDE